jgi:DNA-directed RNA polymerase specialized sigma24 family protein
MQDRELVAAIAAGEPGGLADAYDRYAAPLYAYCRLMLPDPAPPDNAADAVQDTFIIATSRVQGLLNPDRLGPWLHAVARNECLRRLGAAGGAAGLAGLDGVAASAGRPGPDGPGPAVTPPDGLRERVLTACADSTPTGRAYRASVAHRADPFGRAGFPKPVVPRGPRWWQEIRRHPRTAVGVAAAAVVLAAIVAIAMIGAPQRTPAATLALGGGVPGGVVSSQPPGSAGASSPGHGKSTPTPSVPDYGSTPTQGTAPQPPKPSTRAPSSSPSAATSPSASPSPSPSPSPSQGTLRAAPTTLVLSAVKGKAASGTFVLTAVGGPVSHYVIEVRAGTATGVTVSPSSGALGAGGSVTVTVTVKSLVALETEVFVAPGDLAITVVFSIKA